MEKDKAFIKSRNFFIFTSIIALVLVVFALFALVYASVEISDPTNPFFADNPFIVIFYPLGIFASWALLVLAFWLLCIIVLCTILTIIELIVQNKKASTILNWINIVILGIPYIITSFLLVATNSIIYIIIGIIILSIWILDIIATVKYRKAFKQLQTNDNNI